MNSPTPFHPTPTTTTTTTAIPNGTLHQTLMLDSSIRDWVVLPLLIIMILTGLFRFYLSILLKPAKPTKLPSMEHRVKNALVRCSKLRLGGMGYVDEVKWNAKKEYWVNSIDGYWKEELIWVEEEKEEIANQKKAASAAIASNNNNNGTNEDGTPSENPKSEQSSPPPPEEDDDIPNPMEMVGGMKGQAVAMIQNMVMMQGIAFFFQGYVLVKVPFPLTQGFKLMFQRGLDLSTLDTSYVSSVSWYFLVMFGLRSFFKLVMDGQWNSYSGYGALSRVQDESNRMQLELGVNVNAPPAAAAAANKFDAVKVIQMEMENLEIAKYCRGNASLEDVEWRLLGGNAYKKKKRKGGAGGGAAGGLKGKNGDPGYDIFGAAAGGASKKKKGKVKSN